MKFVCLRHKSLGLQFRILFSAVLDFLGSGLFLGDGFVDLAGLHELGVFIELRHFHEARRNLAHLVHLPADAVELVPFPGTVIIGVLSTVEALEKLGITKLVPVAVSQHGRQRGRRGRRRRSENFPNIRPFRHFGLWTDDIPRILLLRLRKGSCSLFGNFPPNDGRK